MTIVPLPLIQKENICMSVNDEINVHGVFRLFGHSEMYLAVGHIHK